MIPDASAPEIDAPPASPSVAVSVDPVMTELGTTAPVTVTLTSQNGFAGPVTVAGALTTPNGDAITDWTVSFDNSAIVPAGGSFTVNGILTTKSTSLATMANTLTVTATSAAPTQTATATVTAANQITLPISVDTTNNTCVYPTPLGIADPVHVRVGTKIRWFNTGTVAVIIHSNGVADGIAHQGQGTAGNDPNTQPGETFEQTLTGNGLQVFTWYCHNLNDLGNGDPAIAADPAP
ncbi:MAG: hypothetical protein QM831_43610 [Kofleriaceae bacterium]